MTRIRGIDFTSSPGKGKPITLAEAKFDSEVLHIEGLRCLTSFEEFEKALREPGPWVAGIDFPFGQPRRLVEALDWPQGSWMDFVAHVDRMEKDEFERVLKKYVDEQPRGDKEHKRATDPSYAVSAMKLNRPPAGKMFFAGAPLISRSGASIKPCAPNESDRVIVEAYAAMVVKALVRKGSYKGESNIQREGRRGVVSALSGEMCLGRYGLTVSLEGVSREDLMSDSQADLLDAVLCAVQAAWASRQPLHGIPEGCDSLEGWIVDPLP